MASYPTSPASPPQPLISPAPDPGAPPPAAYARMTLTPSRGNPLLWREVRAALRNVRAFALLAIYVSILGAIVVSQFPSETNVSLQDGGTRGRDLFWLFLWAQMLLVIILLPSLSVGALAQERERQTLQPLLMTPLTPLQIVWGKAGGSLALAFMLLLATLPLTSLCFLLGGVSPGELAAAYGALLGLALFCIGIGLYCAAHWRNTTQATLISYLILPPALGVMAIFMVPGVVLAGVVMLMWAVWWLSRVWRRWEKPELSTAKHVAWWTLFWTLAGCGVALLLGLMYYSQNFGATVLGVAFIVPYMAFAAQTALQQAAREIAQNPDPATPLKTRVQDFKDEWRAAATSQPVATPTAWDYPVSGASYLPATTAAYTPARVVRTPPKPTYGVEPFLPDNLNPVFAREMRAGLAGKAEYFFRYGYIVTIVTEVAMLGWMALQMASDAYASDAQVLGLFSVWGQVHLALLMLAAAWLGARSFAPEREGQTLPQLLTVPMPASRVAWGKFMAVIAQTGYVFLLGAPLALLLAMFSFLPWNLAGRFFAIEIACAAFAASWGLWCSMRQDAVRRALSWSLGGVAVLIVLGPMFGNVVLNMVNEQVKGSAALSSAVSLVVWPLLALSNALTPPPLYATTQIAASAVAKSASWSMTVGFYATVACVLFALTALAFHRYSKTA